MRNSTSFIICGAHISAVHIYIPMFNDDGSEASFFLWHLEVCVIFQQKHHFQSFIYFKVKYFKCKQKPLTLVICLQVLNVCIARWIQVQYFGRGSKVMYFFWQECMGLGVTARSVVIKDSKVLGRWEKSCEGKELERMDSTWSCIWELTDNLSWLHREKVMVDLHLEGGICLGCCWAGGIVRNYLEAPKGQ